MTVVGLILVLPFPIKKEGNEKDKREKDKAIDLKGNKQDSKRGYDRDNDFFLHDYNIGSFMATNLHNMWQTIGFR